MLKGIGVSEGIVIGKIFLIGRENLPVTKKHLHKSDINKEIQRFRDAISESEKQLLAIKKKVTNNVKSKHLFILDTYLTILRDEVLFDNVIRTIKEKKIIAEWAIKEFLNKFTKIFEQVGDEYLKGKKTDIEHIGIRIITNLTGNQRKNLAKIKEPVVIIADDLTPSDTLQMNKKHVLGFATDGGGKTSHTAILAAAFSIPAVVGLKDITSKVSNGDPIIIDGSDGKVVINPGKEIFKTYLKKQQSYKYYKKELLKFVDLPSETEDGCKISIMANIGYSNEIETVLNFGADGVGLYRTEYHFLNKKRLPSEEELFSDYKKIAERLKNKTAIIRTIDLGGEKFLPHMHIGRKTNPALGLRAIRLCFRYKKIFTTQLKSILRASSFGNIKIMYPMISGIEELKDANYILEEVKNDLLKKGIPFDKNIQSGIMIETPSAAIIADHLAKHVDFFSIGTNDLIQYTLATDRANEQVSYLYQPFHPAILRLIKKIISAANKENIHIGVCGEMGDDPQSILILLGLGKINMLSMGPQSIPKIKKFIQAITIDKCRDIAEKALSLESAKDVCNLLDTYMQDNISDELIITKKGNKNYLSKSIG